MIYRKIFPTYSLEFQITCVLIEKTKMLLLNEHKRSDRTDIIICTFFFYLVYFDNCEKIMFEVKNKQYY